MINPAFFTKINKIIDVSIKRYQLFSRFFKLIVLCRKQWVIIMLLNGIGVLAAIGAPYFTKFFVDIGILNKNFHAFVVLTCVGGVVFVISEILGGVQGILGEYVKKRIHLSLSKKVFDHMQFLSLRWFQEQSTGEQMYKIKSDIDTITDFVVAFSDQMFLFPQLIFTMIMILYLKWEMSVFLFCALPLMFLPWKYYAAKIEAGWKKSIDISESNSKALQEFFSHIQLIKTFGKEKNAIRNCLKMIIAQMRIDVKNTRLQEINNISRTVCHKIVIGGITFYGGYLVIKGKMTLGTFTAVMAYLASCVGLVSQIMHSFQTAQRDFISCQRINAILDEPIPEEEAGIAVHVFFSKPYIEFKNINFGYQQKQYVLKDLSFRIESGDRVAFAGPSGCGKTTLLYLILKLYYPWSGEIIIDGMKLSKIERLSFLRQTSVVLQNSFLWNDTIENNIRYGKVNAQKAEILKVADCVGVHQFVSRLSKGYETVIGENGCKLSEGQKQKIAIARALIRSPKLLIFDEAMSAMDSLSEQRIMDYIEKEYQGTFIVVSHRLSTVMRCNRGYFFESQEKIVVGTPQHFLEKNEAFYKLFVRK